jgi:hypothetical protein
MCFARIEWAGALGPTYALLGPLEGARAEAAEVLRIKPNYTRDKHWRLFAPFQASWGRGPNFDGIRKAGGPPER